MAKETRHEGAVRTAVVERWDDAAATYEGTVEKRTRAFVAPLLERLSLVFGDLAIDVACGTGAVALELARAGAKVLAVDHSPRMVARLRERTAEFGFDEAITTRVGDAQQLDASDALAAATVSGFGVIFCPDIDRALTEMVRVTRPGGVVAFSAWTPMEENGWAALSALDAGSLGFEIPLPEGFAWASERALHRSLSSAGLERLRIETVVGPSFQLASSEGYRDMFKAAAFSPMIHGLPASRREPFLEAFLTQVRAIHGDGPIEIPKRAWIASGVRPR